MIILVMGLPATGKTFVSKNLSEAFNAAYLGTDEIREDLGKKGHYDKESKQEIYEELKQRLIKKLKKQDSVIVDGTFHKNFRRKELDEIANKTNNDLYIIELKASKETVKKRMHKKNRGESEADMKVYKQLKSDYEPPDGQYITLWTDEADIEKIIEKAKEYIQGTYGNK